MRKKYSLFIAGVVLISSMTVAQDYNKWSIGLNVGGHYGATPSIGFKTAQITHYGLNGRYMMNNRGGVMLDFGYDSFKANRNTINVKNHYFRTSFQGVANLGDILMFDTWTKHIGLLIHGGVGASILVNDKSTRISTATNGGKKRDLMLNGIIGITPQVKLGERVSLNLDLSYITHVKQNQTFDMLQSANQVAFKNYFVNWSVGASIYLGKHQTHADWVPTVYAQTPVETNYEDRVKKLEEQLGDDDGDGVFNYRDDEPNTPEGNKVDNRGVTLAVIESDPVDSTDSATPVNIDVKIDHTDIPTEDKDAIKNALKQVNFEFGSSKLSSGSKERLAEVVEVLKKNSTYDLSIEGHTDDIGTEEFNQTLSLSRAKAVYDALRTEGLSKDRMKTTGFGESKPKVANDSDQNRAINRRVELVFIKK